MRALTAWLSSALSSSWAQLAVDVTVKATVLLLLAMLAAAMLRRSSAAVRHRVWCLTFVGLLLLPALSAGLPEWRLAVLPKVVGTLRVPQLPTLESAPAESGALAAPRRDSAQMDSTQRERLFAGPPSFAAPGSPLAEREDYGTRAQRLQPQLPPVASDQANEPAVAHWTIYYLVALWLLGALVAAAPLIIGLLRNYLLRRHARPVAEAAWTGLLDELRARLGLRRQVALYETQTALMPMTWGLLSPVVLLPHRARTWTDRLRRFVLLHELAHVKRCDVGFQMLARLACALYWFHPLAWYALRRLRIERELACDDCVVQAGERPSDYAAELLQIARSFQPLRLTAAVPMAQTSNLEHRIRALFDRARSHLPISSRAARLLLLAATVTVTSIAVIRLAPRPTAEADEPKAAASDSQPDVAQPSSAGAETPTRYFRGAKGDNAQPPSAGAEASSDNAVAIRGRVLDVKGKPIPGARVRVMRIDTESTSWAEVQAPVLADVRTDAEGVFSARYAAESPVATREQFILSTTVVLADADGYAFDWREVKPGEDQFSLQLSPDDAPILGRVLDLEGRPVEGVHVGIHAVQGGGENLDAWIEQAKQNPPSVDEESIGRPIGKRGGGPKIARFPGGKSLETGRPELLPQAVTDQRGRFQLAGLGRDRLVTLELAGGGIAKTWLHVATRDMPAVPYPEYDPRFRVQTCFGRRFELTAEPEQPIAGVIRDADTGEPLPGVEVRLYQYAESLLMVEGFISAVTDKQGRYTLRGTAKPSHPERSTRLRVVPAAGQPYFRTELHVGKQEGLGSATCNVELKRATLIRGQVTDAITGRPIVGLVSYFPFLSNKAAEDYANFVAGMTTMGMFESDATSDDGTFVVPGLPGRGVLAFEAKNDGRYPQSDGAAAIADLTQTTGRGLNLYHLPTTELATALREVDPPTGAAEITCDIKIKPVATVPIRLIDEAGQPLTGVVTRGLRPPRSLGLVFDKEWSPDPLPTDTADLAPGEPPLRRAVLFLHRGRRLATTLWLTEESPPDSLVLRPCGTITGRLVDGSGRPVSGRWVYSRLAQHLDGEAAGRPRDRVEMQHRFASARTDRDGKFQIELLPAGAAYLVSASDGNRQQKAELTTPTLKPGQTFDTGELKLEPSESGGADQPAGAASAAESASAPSATAEDTSHVTLRGLVLDPTGKPFGGAKLFLSYPIVNDLKEQLLGESGKDGRFEFPIDRNSFDVSRVADPWALAKLTAVAEGYGFDWIEAPKAESDCTLRLVDDVPIRGRILTLEGQPVAGAEIKLRQVQVPAQDGIDEFLKMFRAGEVYQFQRKVSQRVPGLRAAATTDAEGRFTLRGLGAERVVELMVAGPGIESWFITAITRDTQPIQRPARWNNSHVYGATFDHLSMPSQKIAGIVRDRKTKKPIADAEVRGSRTVHSARTDAEGRFELLGERKEKEHRLSVLPPAPYFGTQISVTAAGPLDLLPVEIELDRGLEARGHVVVRPSGERATGRVDYFPLWPNKHVAALGPQPGGLPAACRGAAMIRPDGSYSISVLPGPGVLGFITSKQHAPAYLSRADIDRFFGDGQNHGDENSLMVESGNFGPRPQMQKNYHALVLINPAEDATELTVDASVEPGRTLTGTVFDPAGVPLAGVRLRGPQNPIAPDLLDTPQFSLTGLDPRRPGELIFEHRARRLGALRRVTGDEKQPIEVRLEPCGSLTGRLLDVDGEPMPAAKLSVGRTGFLPHDFALETDGDGRFQIDTLVSGLSYDLTLGSAANFLRQKIIVASGEIKDLGDIRLKPSGGMPQGSTVKQNTPAGAEPSPATGAGNKAKETTRQMNEGNSAVSPAASDGSITLRGRVLLPDGKPAAEADLYWLTIKAEMPRTPDNVEYRKQATTDAAGRFELRVSPDELPETYHPASLIALKRGYGLAWLDVKRDEPPGGVTLQLVEDHPIRGRVTDTEGRAVAGARVAVNAVLGSGTRSVDGFLNAWKNNWNSSFGKLDAHLYGRLATLLGAVSDAQGRFELSGLGVERVFRLEITADGYMTCGPHVINRERFDPTDYNRAALAQESAMMRKLRQTPFLAGPRFDYVAETELVVRGIVFTGAAREPVAEAEVSAGIDWGHSVSTKTDDKGHFALHGLSRDRSTLVHIAPPPSSALLFRTMPVNAASRENADNLDVELKRGVVVSGKVFDKTNGRTLRSGVRFVPLPGNAFADQPGYDGFQRDRTSRPTEKGNFRLVVIPGPGVLMAQVHGDGPPINERKIKQYRTASLTREDRERVAPREDDDGVVFTTAYNSIEFLSIENAAKVIDAPLDAKELTCDLPADPGKTVQIAIEDEQGGPLPGVFVAGVTESWPTTYRIDEPTCTIYALGADRPRRLCLLHPERHLAGGVTLTGDEHEIVTVRLGAAASITGRAVDESGAPVADALVQINYARAIARELDRFATLEQPPLKTDADGRFEVGDIVPGERFVLDFKQDDHYFRANLSDDQRTLQAGQKLELGEIKSRQLR